MSGDGVLQIVGRDTGVEGVSPVRVAQTAPLHHVREYLTDRVCFLRKELDTLRAANGATGQFASVIGLLEATLEQAAGAAETVMNDVDAIQAAASGPEKINLASTLMGAVARSHRAAISREQKLTSDSLTECNHSVIRTERGMAAGNGGATNISGAPTANSRLP